jgi:GntR family transcriptional regulator
MEQGLQLDWKVIQADEIAAREAVAVALNIPTGTRIFHLLRLRVANDSPIGYAVSYVPGEFIDKIDLSLTEIGGTMNYISRIDLDHCTAERTVEALPADREDASILSIERGTPVLVISRILRDSNDKPVEYFRGTYRGDRFRYHIQKIPAQV